MKTVEVVNIHRHRRLSIEELLATHATLCEQARKCGQTPVDYVATSFVPEVNPSEGYEAWVVRQVEDVLTTQLWRDRVIGFAADTGTHVSAHVKRITFDPEDVQFIRETFAPREDVQEVWKAAHARAWSKAA